MDEPDFGNDAGGGFNAATRAYKANPTLDTYLKLRRAEPDTEVEVAVIGGFDSLFHMRAEFERFGLDPDHLIGLLDANADAVSALALDLMERLLDSRAREAGGETHLASRGEVIPPKLIDWIICCALDAQSWNDTLHVPRELIVLIRERLGGSNPHYEQVGHVKQMKSSAAMMAGQLKAQGVSPTFRLIGDSLGVAASTVMRWFEPGEFEAEAERWSGLYGPDGRLTLPGIERSPVAPES